MSQEEKEKKDGDALVGRLIKARVIMISEEITDKLARAVTAQCLLMQEDDKDAPITVYVNSPGGSADSGFAIYDILRFVTPPIHMICSGICASAAVLIYMAAEKDKRFSLPNSRFLLHQPSTQLFGTASDIEINANEIIKLRERYNSIIARETGKDVDQITEDCDRDFWLSATEAKEYGLVGKIVEKCSDVS
ncbi:ClpP family protease [Candidatus Uabimicrobium amorphum]|uniref:ATP-dependent Clp protease proteolytic subunit n=1 Tax=Uabimicrobium amorphum TaxID=2596890 RepID=A0A5S9IPE2_UABAM|nr:ATP-dependent Clp protease proteolytic subunit [Candidatus Uabimicrobium amorphum]BBM85031.1 ATP-dependent Clp protease proteolytic subunit 2 [Candidatus Uabimicrobium amorphum]